jgi:hypothetical protein
MDATATSYEPGPRFKLAGSSLPTRTLSLQTHTCHNTMTHARVCGQHSPQSTVGHRKKSGVIERRHSLPPVCGALAVHAADKEWHAYTHTDTCTLCRTHRGSPCSMTAWDSDLACVDSMTEYLSSEFFIAVARVALLPWSVSYTCQRKAQAGHQSIKQASKQAIRAKKQVNQRASKQAPPGNKRIDVTCTVPDRHCCPCSTAAAPSWAAPCPCLL